MAQESADDRQEELVTLWNDTASCISSRRSTNHQSLTGLCNVALCVPEGPDDGVDHQLQLLWRQGVQRVKAVVGDRPKQVEELQSVLREVLQRRVQLNDRPWADMAWDTMSALSVTRLHQAAV